MQVFIPTGFANIVNSCNAELKQILPFIEKYLGKTISDKFINACKKNDYKTANKIIDNTIEKISGQESVADALIVLADKFTELNISLSGKYSDVEKIEYMNQYADRMLKIIEKEYLH